MHRPAALPVLLLLCYSGPWARRAQGEMDAAVAARSALAEPDERPRLLVLTDIGGDPDDIQSMRRLMLYANELRIVGLIASASGTPGEVGREVTRPDLMRQVVQDYAAVRESLARHARGYPTPGELRRVIRSGSPRRGVPNLGKGRSTEGSRHIAAAADASEEPLYVAIWGGAHDLAQALYDVRGSRAPEKAAQFVSKLRVYAIADQDGDTGRWIRREFPELRYVETGPPGVDRFAALFRGMYQNDSVMGPESPVPLVEDEVAALNQEVWVEAHVRIGHGPLGAGYSLVTQNPTSRRNTLGVKEGDTPSWFFVLPNGLGDPEQPTWGGWGGRFRHREGGHFVDAEDEHPSGTPDAAVRRKWTVARWRRPYQNDFQARMDWCVKPFPAANHTPVAVVNGDRSRRPLRLRARPGEEVKLDASASADPDRHALSFRWWVYAEAGSYRGRRPLAGAGSPAATVRVPADAGGETLHVILEVGDDGTPPLTAYRRIVLEVAGR